MNYIHAFSKSWKILSAILFLIILSLPFIFRPYVVTGVSMEPTFQPGTVLVVDYLSAHVWPPQRGEFLVFRNPHDSTQVDLKRVIGLPDEDVSIGQNNVTIIHPDGNAETFTGTTDIGRGATETFRMKLGPSDYFLLGDNRSQSTDSRSFGAVQPTNFIGRVVAVVKPRFRLLGL